LRGSLLPSSLATYQASLASPTLRIRRGTTILGSAERAEGGMARHWQNGVAAHGLEMDDVENRSSLHPGVVVFPAPGSGRAVGRLAR